MKKELDRRAEIIIRQEKRITELEKENEELKEAFKHFNPCGDWNDDVHDCEFRHYAIEYGSKLTKATEIIKSLIALHYNPVVTKDDLKKQDKILEQAEQFLREIDIGNAIQKANEGLNLDKIAEEVEDDLKEGCPDVLCEECTKEDCTVRKLGLVSTKEIEK